MVSAVIAIALTVYVVITNSAPVLADPALAQPGPTRLIVLGMLLCSIGVYFLGRSNALSPERMLDVGLAYEVFLAFMGGVALQYFAAELRMPVWGVSEIAIVILVFAILVPNTPGRVLLAALVAATMDPIGDLIYGLRGGETPTLVQMVGAYYANYLAAGIALVTAHVLTSLAQEVGEARELGSYRLTERLGRGGMGEVWRADHRMLARPAAIKLIRPDMLISVGDDRETLVRRFEREAQATALLRSPHTIDVFDFGVTPEGSLYYVMELLDGLDMQTLVERYGPIQPARSAYLLAQVCDSLLEAHENGLVHRDIKPANIYVCRYGIEADFVKVLDFGLVGRRPDLAADTRLTMGDCPGGTPAFMAPEQILGQTLDGRTDIYALGCLAYWLLTGGCVFSGGTPLDALVKHAREIPEPPSARSELAIPAELDQLVLACLEKDPDRRPPNAGVLRSRLDECVPHGGWTAAEARAWWDLHRPTTAKEPPAAASPAVQPAPVAT
ncbi:MAG: serine/threonine protein kinase [Gemmatimonadota bacterium]|nr:MAG: serine/threonine protein kinase [Gemmatimonadota bacterium]